MKKYKLSLRNILKSKLFLTSFLSISLLQSNTNLNDLNIYSKQDLDLILENYSDDLVYLPIQIRDILKSINLDLEDISILEFRAIRELFEALAKKEDLLNSIPDKDLNEIEQYISKIDDYKIDSKKLRSRIIDRLKIKNLIAKYGNIKTLNVHELLINCKPFEPCNCSGAGATGATGVTGPTGPGSGSTGATGVTGATGTFDSNFSGCIAGPILLNSGSSGAPAYSFCSKTGTGMYLDATGLAFVYGDPNFAYLTIDSFNLSTGVLKAEDFATPNMRLVIAPKGNGALQASVDGDSRGEYATDLQRARFDNSQVAGGNHSVISGGRFNTIDTSSQASIINGGTTNSNTGSNNSVISGGSFNNNIGSNNSIINGGYLNNNTGSDYSAISGGSANGNTGSDYSIINGGNSNRNIDSDYSTISGGRFNSNTDSDYSIISGGRNNSISASDASFAAGSGAQVLNGHNGSFVWSDGTYGAGSVSNGVNTFNVYSTGGIFLENLPDASGTPVSINGTQLVRETSSKRYKKEITNLEDKKSELIYNLNPVEFLYNSQNTGPKEIGLIAEDVENISNQLVIYNNKGEVESVKYRYLPILMINEMKKIKNELNENKTKFNKLEKEIQQILSIVNAK